MTDKKFGKKIWSFSGGYIPLESTGKEPEFLSKDELSILNITKKNATVKITVFFTDAEPVGEYEIKVKPKRLRKFRINDLIDPHALPLGVAYGAVLESDVRVIVQFSKQITAQDNLAMMGTMAFPGG